MACDLRSKLFLWFTHFLLSISTDRPSDFLTINSPIVHPKNKKSATIAAEMTIEGDGFVYSVSQSLIRDELMQVRID